MSDSFFSTKQKPAYIKRYPPIMKFWGRILSYALPFIAIVWACFKFDYEKEGLIIACLFLGMALLSQLRQLFKLTAWLLDPSLETAPDAKGNWGDVFLMLYQQEKRRRKDQRKLAATLTRFTRGAEALPDGVVVLDENHRIEWCNVVAERHLGLSRKRDMGLTINYLIRQPHFVEYINNERYKESITIHPDAAPNTLLSVQIFPFEATLKLLVTRDITQLEKIGVVHRDFVANVSHELRTPLTVVGGFLETMLDMENMEAAASKRYMGMMLDQTKRMERLIADLLTLSRLESQSGQHKEEPVNIPKLVEIMAHETRSLSGGRHQITIEVLSADWLHGNMDELHSAMGNLASNAVRYTPEGGSITLKWERQGEIAVFSVKDTGIGIDQEHIDRLTERFYRVDRSRSRETGGTGLGLAIVKHALLRHQAKLEVSSVSGEGSTFSAVFPSSRIIPRSMTELS
ncbi:phosphate regulon sensor histidine kinase PhoR [Leeia sp. TBRC 13508]|uniref:Phosphate regulon sensor protein PhoR n=1 Tax=Leeia speluncae TaxID=2884804 RepID=A0ABS8D781_9NEIS|nr:phosphate regulon sensor histidine kinase PhoR [Leeia speluncae]MCB6183836.1 phosphate regulon sensor histidine kinase PhoR [Leeia speluncae]